MDGNIHFQTLLFNGKKLVREHRDKQIKGEKFTHITSGYGI
jgi:hypothetical protein